MTGDQLYPTLLKELKTNAFGLETRAGLGNGIIKKAIKNKSEVALETLEKIKLAYPAVNAEWLRSGEGTPIISPELNEDAHTADAEMAIKQGKQKTVIPLGKHVPLRLKPDEYGEAFGDWPGLPIYNEPITASFVASYRDNTLHQPMYYLHDPRFLDCDFGAVITGDSMHPEIRHGDIVACKMINDKTFIVFGDIYYIVASNGLETCKYVQRVKRLREGAEKRGKGGSRSRWDEADIIYDEDQVLLVPYNTSIDPSPILKAMIEKLYKVRGIIRGY
jgi:hypothetical protein